MLRGRALEGEDNMNLEVTHELGVEGGLVPGEAPSDADLFDSIADAIATVDDTITLDKTKFTTEKAYAVSVTTTAAAGASTASVASGMGLEEDDMQVVEDEDEDKTDETKTDDETDETKTDDKTDETKTDDKTDEEEEDCGKTCDGEPTDCDSYKTMSAGCASDCPADQLAAYEKQFCGPKVKVFGFATLEAKTADEVKR